uniref:C2H2-type domain-containing protein n=1 Tax=Meloidogyne javanica TaxID=6303 RepID=A0A915LWT3_MELJA
MCRTTIKKCFLKHAYSHIIEALWRCAYCVEGSNQRNTVVKHCKEMHGSDKPPLDARFPLWDKIKHIIQMCYPYNFIEMPEPKLEVLHNLQKSYFTYATQYHIDKANKKWKTNNNAQKQKQDDKKIVKRVHWH